MSAPYYIETLARNGDVLTRQAVASMPIRLGRAYDNDVVLDDDHAGAHHARIEINGDNKLVLHDLGSQNGTVHLGKRQVRVTLTGDTVVRVGHTNLRVRSASHAVPAELVDRTMHSFEGAIPALLGLCLITLFAVITTWTGDTQVFQATRYLQVVASATVLGLAWAGVWAFANRLFGRHARLGRHLFILGSGLAAMGVLKVVSSLAAYAFSIESLTRYASPGAIAIVAVMLFFHLCTIKPQHPRSFGVTAGIMFVIGVGLTLISNQQATGRVADELYMTVLRPPSVRMSANHSVDDFIGSAAKLKARLDQERTKKVKGDGSEDDE